MPQAPRPRLTDERRAAMRAALVAHAGADERAPRRRRWRLPVLIPVFVVMAAGGATAAGLFSGEVDTTQVACYRAASPDAAYEVVPADERSPVAQCAPYWKRGEFGDGRGVPPLIACVRGERTAVLPGERGTCARLGMQALAPEAFQSQARRRAAFQEGLRQIGLHECHPPAEVRRDLRSLLERLAMTGWKIHDATGGAECVASVSGSHDRREMTIDDEEWDGEVFIGDDGFGISGSAGSDAGEEITREEFDRRVQEGIRRACSEQATSEISNILSCLDAKRTMEDCPSARVAKAAIEPLVVSELGRGARVVIVGEGDCFMGWEVDEAAGEIRLDAVEAP